MRRMVLILLMVAMVVAAALSQGAMTTIAGEQATIPTLALYLPIVVKPPPTPTPNPTPTNTPMPTPTFTPTPLPTATPTPSPGTMPSFNLVCKQIDAAEVCASVSVPNPARRTIETVYGRLVINGAPVAGAQMITTWHYKSSTPSCNTGVTDAGGVAHCARNIGGATAGYTVYVDVVINGYGVTTWFTPQ